jgi:putative ABC transport system permease protein
MNIFNKITLQSLKRNRTRTIVTIIGVILSAAMITGVTTFIASLQNYLIRDTIARNGDWHIAYTDVDADFVQRLNADSAVESNSLVYNIGYSVRENIKDPSDPYFRIVGFNEEGFHNLPVELLFGRLPQNNGEIVIPEYLLNTEGIEYGRGDTLLLEVGNLASPDGSAAYSDETEGNPAESFRPQTSKTYKIVGICAEPSEVFTAVAYTMTASAEIPNSRSGSFDAYVKLGVPAQVYDFANTIAGDFDYEFNSELLRYYGVSDNSNFNTVLYSLSVILIALIMLGSILLIYNSFALSVSERTRQFGILSSVGATKKQLRKSVLFEGICIGVVGVPLGIVAGIIGIGATLKFADGILANINPGGVPLDLSLSVAALVVAGIVSIITILLSAYIPARKAAGRCAIDSIRQTNDVKISAKSVKNSKLTNRLFGLEGMLASKNWKRDKKRYRTTVFSLFVSVVLFIAASSYVMYLKIGAEHVMEFASYDIMFYADDMKDEEALRLYDQMKSVSGITDSSYTVGMVAVSELSKDVLSDVYVNSSGIQDGVFDMRLSIQFVDDTTYSHYLQNLGLSASAYAADDTKMIAYAKITGRDNNGRYGYFDMFRDKQPMTLQIRPIPTSENVSAEPKDITVTFVDELPKMMSKRSYVGLHVFAPYSMVKTFGFPAKTTGLSLTFMSKNPAVSGAEMQTIVDTYGIESNYTLDNVAGKQEQDRSMLLVINVFAYGFIILISLIAIANVFNTVSTNINLRKREFAMLRSVGMTNRCLHKMMNLECVIYGIKTLLLGLPVAVVITYLIYLGTNSGVDIPFTLPWASIGISVFSVFFVVFVTMLYAVSKVKKANVIDALREEIA